MKNSFYKYGGGLLFIGFIVISIVTLVSAMDKSAQLSIKQAEISQIEKNKHIQLCIDKGGIPKISYWDGRLVDCIIVK